MQNIVNPNLKEPTNSPQHPTDIKDKKLGKTLDSTKEAVKRHGSGGSGSSPDQEDFVMVPSDLTKDAAEIRKHNRDAFT